VVYREVLALDAKDAVALRAVVEAYERAEQWAELAALLRSQVEATSIDAEKVHLLRRLLGLYEERLADVSSASWAAAQILKLVPGDREALLRLESILERSSDKPRLVKMLEYHLRYSTSAEEKLGLVRRVADLLQNQVDDFDRAIPYWENILKHVPGTSRRCRRCSRLRKGRTARGIWRARWTCKSPPWPPIRRPGRSFCGELARLAGDALKQTPRAQQAWQDLLKIVPGDREALEALSAIASAQSDWATLADLLARRIALSTNPAEAVPMALERARLLVEKLDDSAPTAIRALEHTNQ